MALSVDVKCKQPKCNNWGKTTAGPGGVPRIWYCPEHQPIKENDIDGEVQKVLMMSEIERLEYLIKKIRNLESKLSEKNSRDHTF